MKTKIKRHGRSVISVILAVCLLISCMTVGLIATDAAKVDDEPLGYNSPAKIAISTSTSDLAQNQHDVTITSNSGSYTVTGAAANTTYYFNIKGDSDVFGNAAIGTNYNTNYNLGLITGGSLTDNNGCSRFTTTTAGDYEISFKIAGSSGSTVKVIKGSSSSTECSTDGKFIVTGNKAITGTSSWQNSWSGATSRNQFVYDANLKCYKVEYKNVSALSSAALFRVLNTTDTSDWEQTMGYDQSTRSINPASIATVTKGSDNNFSMTSTQKTNITIYLDDSKAGTTEMLTVIITPAVSTVTAGTQTGGTVKVNGGSSASNIAYNGTVSLTATPDDYYHFGSWDSNDYLTYTNANAASTTAAVTGTTTVNATFVKDSYTVTKGTGDGFTITAPATTNTSMQWGEDLTITANSDNMHYIDYLYYKVNNAGDEVKIGLDAGSNATTLTRTLSMPKSNVTVYAHVHEKSTNTITYGYCTGSEGLGYINVGKQHNTSTSQIEYSIESGSKVLEGTNVLFGARPIAGKKFVGWYSNQAGTNQVYDKTNKDKAIAVNSDTTLYAKFADAPDTTVTVPDPLAATSGITVYVKDDAASTNDLRFYWWNQAEGDPTTTWNQRPQSETGAGPVTVGVGTNNATNKTNCYRFDFPNSNTLWVKTSLDSQESNDYSIPSAGTYVIEFKGGGKDMTVSTHTNTPTTTTTPDPDKATTTYYPVKLEVTNPDKGSAYVEYFAAGGESKTVTHTPTDTENDKTQYVDNSAAAVKTTSTTHSLAMPADGTSTKTTVTFIPKEYYKVTFSAGAGGTISATAGGATITSGTMVKEGTQIVFTAAPDTANGYTVAGWTGDVTSGIATTKTITAANFTSAKTARVYFSKNKGTENTGTYFGYFADSSYPTDGSGSSGNPQRFSVSKTYTRNGHTYGYIDTISNSDRSKYFFVAAFSSNATTDRDKCQKMYYQSDTARDNIGNIWYATDFSDSFNDLDRVWYKSNYDSKNCWNYYIRFKVAANVVGVIVDLGETNSDGSTTVSNNCYRLIPVLNKDITKVTVYAKDGTYRGDDTDDKKYDYFPAKANTVISSGTGISNIAHHTNMDTADAVKGSTVTVTTTITDETAAAKFYVRGFSFNGVTPLMLKPTTCTHPPLLSLRISRMIIWKLHLSTTLRTTWMAYQPLTSISKTTMKPSKTPVGAISLLFILTTLPLTVT